MSFKDQKPLDPLLEGGCLCGAIRYLVTSVFEAGYCHCPLASVLFLSPSGVLTIRPNPADDPSVVDQPVPCYTRRILDRVIVRML